MVRIDVQQGLRLRRADLWTAISWGWWTVPHDRGEL
jgi:hypothetical protein